MHSIIIAFDNGVSGSIAVLDDSEHNNSKVEFYETPIKTEQSYTKKKQTISRIDHFKLYENLKIYKGNPNVWVVLERPMTNALRVMATLSGARAFESTLCVVERLELGYEVVDSKQWQSKMLPLGLKKEELKKASMDVGIRMFPLFKDIITKHKDADSLLMAVWAKRLGL